MVFGTADGNIVNGMNGIYIGKFNNGPLTAEGNVFGASIYLICTLLGETAVYVFNISQYADGWIFFNRMNASNVWQLNPWRKLIPYK